MKTEKKKIKRKLKFRNLMVLFFFFLFLGLFFYYVFTLPMKNIIIKGTNYLSDDEIIRIAEIKNYPSLYRTSTARLKEKIMHLDFVESVKIHKQLSGRLTIEIKENMPLFYNRNKEVLVLSNGKEIKHQILLGFPVLINYVPDEMYERLLKEVAKTDMSVLKLVSEIEYQPWKSDDVVIDDTRFFLRMNDGNCIYVNLINWDKLNNYMEIYATLGTAKGTLQLDSSLGNGITFTPYS